MLSLFEDLINHITLSDPLFYLILGDFNARSANSWDDGKISIEGTQLDALSSFHCLHQLIKKATHIMENSTSCIDLIFTNQPNLVIDSGVHPSLHTNCHHQILYCKLNLNIKFPPQKFNKFIVSIFSNFVPNRLVTCDDMDPP